MILIQTFDLFDAAVRYIRKLRFSVGVFFSMPLCCFPSRFLLKRGRVFAALLMMFLMLCSCSSRAEEPVLEPIETAGKSMETAEKPIETAENGRTSAPDHDNSGDGGKKTEEGSAVSNTKASAGQSRADTQELLTVHVCGEVRKEGVYTLPAGSRILDAVEAAGGFSEQADRSWLNLAMEIGDAWQIRVPSSAETDALRLKRGDQALDEKGTPYIMNGEASAGEFSGHSSRQAAGAQTETGRINLNTASKEELMEIPGVGEAKAQRIIEYRKQNGRFESIEDLMKVPGIKNASFQKMKDYITV